MQPTRLPHNPLLPIAFAVCAITSTAIAQTTAPAPAFEVVTIKPLDPKGGLSGFYSYPGGRVLFGYANIKMLVMYAYNVQEFQITGEPAWSDSERYNIVACRPTPHPPAPKNRVES